MKKFAVEIPIAGSLYLEVEAENAEEALEVAWEEINNDGESAGELMWEFYEKIVEGNVCHVGCSEIAVDELEASDED